MKKQGLISFIAAFAAIIICFLLIADSGGAAEAAKRSITVCLSVIIPSLFAFMVFSQVIIKCGIADLLFYPLYKISFWFKGSRREFSIFMLSLIGGYPVGIKLLKEYIAYNKNYSEIAAKMLCYCYCGSPSFIIQIAGITVLGSFKAGLLVYLSNAAACFSACIIINLFEKTGVNFKEGRAAAPLKLKMTDFTESIGDSVRALGIICGTILAFNIFLELIRFIGFNSLLENTGIEKIIAAAFEISNISMLAERNFGMLPVISALTSFGGICILIQTAALSKGEIPLKSFILARFPIALLSAAFTCLFMKLFPISIESSVSNAAVAVSSEVNPIVTACLVIMTLILIKDIEKTKS
ncbi:MAG: hypothetical protein NC203_01860 [Firmicutes bacterium]|nr:hypothetical protein [Bacillota bacterium]